MVTLREPSGVHPVGGRSEVLLEVLEEITRIEVPGALNIYDETACRAVGEAPGAATERWHALGRYLDTHWCAPTLLVGEAPGQDGARWTGVPFTSCRQLTGGGPGERTAETVHRALAELGATDQVVLWNASVLFASGNRDPRRAELEACAHLLVLMSEGRSVFAIGRIAEAATGAPYLRHPSYGGGPRFAEGLRVALRSPAGTDVRHALGKLDATTRPRTPVAERGGGQ